VGEINEKWLKGEVAEAMKKIDEFHGKIDELAEKGEIASSEVVTALHQGLDDLEKAMLASAPPIEEEEGHGDEGNGRGNEGKGKGKGND
jgi:hypothetical protein